MCSVTVGDSCSIEARKASQLELTFTAVLIISQAESQWRRGQSYLLLKQREVHHHVTEKPEGKKKCIKMNWSTKEGLVYILFYYTDICVYEQ